MLKIHLPLTTAPHIQEAGSPRTYTETVYTTRSCVPSLPAALLTFLCRFNAASLVNDRASFKPSCSLEAFFFTCKQKQRLFLFPTSTHRGTIPDVCKAPTPLLRTSKMHLQRNYKGRGHDMLRGGLKIANVGPFSGAQMDSRKLCATPTCCFLMFGVFQTLFLDDGWGVKYPLPQFQAACTPKKHR